MEGPASDGQNFERPDDEEDASKPAAFIWANIPGISRTMRWPVKVVKLPLVYCNCDDAWLKLKGNDFEEFPMNMDKWKAAAEKSLKRKPETLSHFFKDLEWALREYESFAPNIGAENEILATDCRTQTETLAQDTRTENETLVQNARTQNESLAQDARSENENLAQDARTENETFAQDTRTENEALSQDTRTENEALAQDARTQNETLAQDTRTQNETSAQDTRTQNETFAQDTRTQNETFAQDARTQNEALAQDARTENETLAQEARTETETLAQDTRTECETLAQDARTETKTLAQDARTQNVTLAQDTRTQNETLAQDARTECETLAQDARTETETLAQDVRTQNEALAQDARTENETLAQDAKTECETLAQDARTETETLVQDARTECETLAQDARTENETLAQDARTECETLAQDARTETETLAQDSGTENEILAQDSGTENETLVPDAGTENETLAKDSITENETLAQDIRTQNETLAPDIRTENKILAPNFRTKNETLFQDIRTKNETLAQDARTENKTLVPDDRTENETSLPDSHADSVNYPRQGISNTKNLKRLLLSSESDEEIVRKKKCCRIVLESETDNSEHEMGEQPEICIISDSCDESVKSDVFPLLSPVSGALNPCCASDDSDDQDVAVQTVMRDSKYSDIYVSCAEKGMFTKSGKKKKTDRKYNARHVCPFCKEKKTNFSHHILSKQHAEEEDVKIIKRADGDERKRLINRLRLKACHEHNLNTLKEKKGEIFLLRRFNADVEESDDDDEDNDDSSRSKTFQVSKYGPCPNCFGWVLKKSLKRHFSSCSVDESVSWSNRALETQSDVIAGKLTVEASQTLIKEVFPIMKSDEISRIAKDDDLIVNLGNQWLMRNRGNAIMRKYYTSTVMRLSAKLKLACQKISKQELNMTSFLAPKYFETVLKAALSCCHVEEDMDEELKAPSNAIKLGFDIKRMLSAKLSKSIVLEDLVLQKEANDFMRLMEIEWSLRVTKLARGLLVERAYGKTNELPRPSDVKRLFEYLKCELTKLDLTDSSYNTYRNAVTLTLARLTMYNRRRCHEVQAMRLSSYAARTTGVDEIGLEIRKELTEFERMLLSTQEVVVIRGKTGKGVPVILPGDVKNAMKYITSADVRSKAGIQSDNKYVFASKGVASVFRAYDAIREVTQAPEANLQMPNLLRTSNMRKYMATMLQPERIDPPDPQRPDYDIRADVWSLGITLVELATGEFPYKNCRTDFEVLTKVLSEDPPLLPPGREFSHEFCSFVRDCLTKDYKKRPKYRKLLEHIFIKKYEREEVDVAAWFSEVSKVMARFEPS